jgi:hypothetical protein
LTWDIENFVPLFLSTTREEDRLVFSYNGFELPQDGPFSIARVFVALSQYLIVYYHVRLFLWGYKIIQVFLEISTINIETKHPKGIKLHLKSL